MDDLARKIEALQREVEDFVDSLRARHEPTRGSARGLRVDWRGALVDLRDHYTSVELQHEASRLWRGD